jgi:uncharacterized protein
MIKHAMMALGPFAFGLNTAAYDQLQRQMQFKHAAAVRVGARDAYQRLGPGSETLTLSGTVAPEVTGTLASITELEDMGRDGLSYVLIDGAGYVYGVYYIDSLQTTQSYHHADGTPRKVEFSLTLGRSDDLPSDSAPRSDNQAVAP